MLDLNFLSFLKSQTALLFSFLCAMLALMLAVATDASSCY